MAFNKNKVIALAQKYVQKGQIDRAVKEYQKVLDEDKKDIRTRLKIGDLLAKKGDVKEAVKVYQEAAESYSKDGFFLKAVAVYKNVLKLTPDLIEINLKLGDLYRQLSLLVDAMAQYQIVVNYYDKKGMVKEALDTLKKMVELDPENITFKVNLAELYHKEGHIEQAKSEYETIARELKEANKDEELIKVYERMLHHQPERFDIVKDVSKLYLKMRQGQRALAKLQVCFKADPKDPQTLELLAESFLMLDQPKKAKSVYKELSVIYEASGNKASHAKVVQELKKISPEEEVASLEEEEPPIADIPEGPSAAPEQPAHLPPEVTRYDEEVTEFSLHTGVSPLAPASPEPSPMQGQSPLSAVDDVTAPSVPLGEDALDSVVDLEAGAIEEDFENLGEEISKLFTETDVYLKYGLNDKAKEHLELILSKNPKHLEARTKLKELYVNISDKAQAVIQLKELIQITEASGDAAQAKQFHEELSALDAQAASAVPAPKSSVAKPAVKQDPQPEPLDASFDLSGDFGLDISGAELESATEMALQSGDLEELATEPSVESDEKLSVPQAKAVNEAAVDAAAPEIELGDLDLGIEVDLDTSDITQPPVSEVMEKDSLEESGMEAHLLMDQAEEAAAVLSDELPDESSFEEVLQDEIPEPIFTPSLEESVSREIPLEVREELDEAEFFVQQGLHDEAKKIYEDLLKRFASNEGVKSEVHEKLIQLPDEDGAQVKIAITDPPKPVSPTLAAIGEEPNISFSPAKSKLIVKGPDPKEEEEDHFDLAAELSADLEEFEEIQVEETESPSEEVDFKEVFEEFKKGVASQLGNEDSETHFDLGLAYKEMYLLDDAIHEFQVAMGEVKKTVECLTMIGLCHMDKGEFDQSEIFFQKGLAWKSVTTQEIIGLNYELAMAQLANDKTQDALASLERVKNLDASFRNVTDKIREIQESGGLESSRVEEELEEPEGFDLGKSLALDDEEVKPAKKGKATRGKPTVSQENAPESTSEESELTDLTAFDTPSEKTLSRKSVQEIPAPVAKPAAKSAPAKQKSKISYI